MYMFLYKTLSYITTCKCIYVSVFLSTINDYVTFKPPSLCILLKCLTVVKFAYNIQDGRSALYQASKNNHLEVVQLLLQKHADVNTCDEV